MQAVTSAEFATNEHLAQLHQWQLWNRERRAKVDLPDGFLRRCQAAFMASPPKPSRMQRQVEATLVSLSMPVRAEVFTDEGYSIDVVVNFQGAEVGVEVDGPSHFFGRDPSGPTLLKRRQLRKLGGWKLCSVPYWEWDEVWSDAPRRQQYLLQLLRRTLEA
uniref:RAP domain-containing protein n=2 Tax=Chrysotila carterae TaxID=13221 RepID=A0A7S4F983_CHRCT